MYSVLIINNYSPKWRWLVVDIYRAARRQGKYPPLTTDTEVNSCFLLVYTKTVRSYTPPKIEFELKWLGKQRTSQVTIQRGSDRCKWFFVVKTAVSFSRWQIQCKIFEDICLALVATFLQMEWQTLLSLYLKPFCKKYHSIEINLHL